MVLTFDEQTKIELKQDRGNVYSAPRMTISFSPSAVVQLTPKELDIFISALQIVRGNE